MISTLTWSWLYDAYICTSFEAIIASDNGLSPVSCQAIIWTNAGLLLDLWEYISLKSLDLVITQQTF